MIESICEQLRGFIVGHHLLEAPLRFLGALASIALHVWFLLFSSFGAPPEFIYDQF